MTLAVSEVFGPTFQGEGPTAGRRCGFVRLARCNLDCAWCDTAYTWDWSRFDPGEEVHAADADDVAKQLDAMGVDRVVVTGGEPLLQQGALVPLLERCARAGRAVEVETNGTVAPQARTVELVERFNVSPKLANSGVPFERRIRPVPLHALRDTGKAAFKFVVRDAAELDEVAAIAGGHDLAPVWVMPEGTTPEAVLDGLRRLAEPVSARGWHLGTRLHVLVWGDERGR